MALILTSAPSVFGQMLPTSDYRWVKAFLWAAVPELRGHGYPMELTFNTGFDSDKLPPSVRVTVWGEGSPLLGGRGWEQGAVLLNVHFASHPESIGDHIKLEWPDGADTKALASVEEEASAHPEWKETDLLDALHRAHADFPPDRKEAFLQHLDVHRFGPVLGTIQKVNVDFLWRRPEVPQEVHIRWRVWLETVAPDGRVAKYLLAFEPIRGRLDVLMREWH